MTRPYDWFPLAASDPIPGDPGTVRVAGDAYASVATTIATAAARLDEIAAIDGSVSDAVDTIRDKAKGVAEAIVKARNRYQTTGEALTTYAGQLAQAQADSEAALRAAQSAQSAIDSAEADVRRATTALDDAEPADQATKQTAINQARSAVGTADTALSRARTDLQAAIDLRDRAAQQAIGTIEDITGSDGLNDGWWENWGSRVAHFVSELAGTIAMVAGILSLVLCWVPVLGQALAAVALIATAVALVADIVLLIAGEGSWAKVGLGLLSIATFGAGRVATAGLRMASTGAVGSARLAAGSAAAMSPAARLAQGLPGARNAAAAIDDMAGAAGALTRPAARGMAANTNTLLSWRGLGMLASELKPSVMFGGAVDDIAALGSFSLGNFRTGWTAVASAQGPAATFAALTGQGGSVGNLNILNGVSPALADFSAQFGRASNTVSGAAVGVGGVTGADAYQNGSQLFDWVTGLSEPSPAASLRLQ